MTGVGTAPVCPGDGGAPIGTGADSTADSPGVGASDSPDVDGAGIDSGRIWVAIGLGDDGASNSPGVGVLGNPVADKTPVGPVDDGITDDPMVVVGLAPAVVGSPNFITM